MLSQPTTSVRTVSTAPITELVSPAAIRLWLALATQVLLRDREILNSANVFPVADADTGTNMSVTLRTAAQGVAATSASAGVAELLAAGSRWALGGARGNSGVILSEWLRGFALAIGRRTAPDGPPVTIGSALEAAAAAARTAVVDPAPGSILTAMQAAADEAVKFEAENTTANAAAALGVAVAGARRAAENSPHESAVLARSGVLDSGACGFVLALEALKLAVAADPATLDDANPADLVTKIPQSPGRSGAAAPQKNTKGDAQSAPIELRGMGITPHGSDSGEDGFEVMFNLERPNGASEYQSGSVVKLLRKQLSELGNSVVVIGGAATDIDIPDCIKDSQAIPSAWHAHVHVADLGPIMELADTWRQQGQITGEQVRFLAAPHSPINIWAVATDPAVVRALAEFGVTVQVVAPDEPSAGVDLARSLQNELAPKVLALVPSWVGADNVDKELTAQNDTYKSQGLHGQISTGTEPTQFELVDTPNEAATVALLLASVAEGEDFSDNTIAATNAGNQMALLSEARERLAAKTVPVEEAQLAVSEFLKADNAQTVVALLPPDAPTDLAESLEADCEEAGVEFFSLPLDNPGPAQIAAVRRA